MKKTFVMSTVFVAFAILLTSLPCYAGKKSTNTQAIQPAGEDGVINGCYKKVNGQLRVVNSTDFCGPSEYAISWNQAGQAGLIDLANTYVKNTPDCLCDNNGWVLHGYASCPPSSVLSSIGTPMDASDYGFYALCTTIDGSNAVVNPLAIAIRCVGPSAQTNCNDATNNDGDGMNNCDDPDCASNLACMPVGKPINAEDCTDGLDNDADGLIDCKDSNCASDPGCKKKKK